jgi:hypothetical protein
MLEGIMSKQYLYGQWSSLGYCWGGVEIEEDGTITDFTPEWQMKQDLLRFWKAQKPLIKVIGISGYLKELYRGIKLYKRLV